MGKSFKIPWFGNPTNPTLTSSASCPKNPSKNPWYVNAPEISEIDLHQLSWCSTQCGAPKIAKLVQITPIKPMVYGTYNYIYGGL